MIRVVDEAGGVTVLAHPWGRHGPGRDARRARSTELAGLGLAGLEVDHQDHRPRTASGSARSPATSAWSSPAPATTTALGKLDHELGCNTTAPEEYERLLELAAAAGARSGRHAPRRWSG